MNYSEKELKCIQNTISPDDDTISTVRGLLTLCLEEWQISKEAVNDSKAFQRYVKKNAQLIHQLLKKQKEYAMKLSAHNEAFLRWVVQAMSMKSAITKQQELKIIKLAYLELYKVKKKGLLLSEVYALLSELSEDTEVKLALIKQEIHEWLKEFTMDEKEDNRFHLTILLTSTGELKGVIWYRLIESRYFQGADFLITNDLKSICHILENFWYREEKEGIDECFWERLEDYDAEDEDEERDDEDDDDDDDEWLV